WKGARAVAYRRQNKISDSLGTAVNVVAMVFGTRGEDSGTGVALRRDPATGERTPYGDYLPNAQGEDVVAGIRNTLRLDELAEIDPASYQELRRGMDILERHYRDMCDIEFTIERGKLWFLQTRVGKRTAFAEWVIAHDMVAEGLISLDEGLLRLDPNRLIELFKDVIERNAKARETPLSHGLNASPGAAVGRVVFTADDARDWAERGEKVILVRRETTPDDYHGMVRSQGILTSAGGTNSHAAVVARGEGIPAVCGADAIHIQRGARAFSVGDTRIEEGDVTTIDGFDGSVYAGELPLEPRDFVGIFEAMDGLPVTVRLLDPPLHEFLPNHVDMAVAVALAEERGDSEVIVRDEKIPFEEAREILRKVEELHEANPMLGLRGVRLGIVKPGLYAMQVRAIVEAACDRVEAGGHPEVEIMIPLVATQEELRQMREELEPAAQEVLTR